MNAGLLIGGVLGLLVFCAFAAWKFFKFGEQKVETKEDKALMAAQDAFDKNETQIYKSDLSLFKSIFMRDYKDKGKP